MTAPSLHTVLILGAGLAGLTAAYYLQERGYTVTLLEYPEWPDGFRANPSETVPALLGCYQESQRFLQALGPQPPWQADRAIPLEFRMPDGHISPYQSTRLPGAFQWMMSLFSFHGLAWQDRWRLFSHVEQIWEQAESLPEDLENRTADEWLVSTGQSPEARARIWNPLAQWLTGNPLTRLSGATFVQLLSTIFLSDASGARLTHLSGTVDQRFLSPMKRILQEHKVRIVPLAYPPDLQFGQDGVSQIRLHDGAHLQARWCIIALSYQHLLRLLPERLLTRYAYFAQMTEIQCLSEIVVQLTYPATNQTPRLLLLPGRPFQQLTITSLAPGEIEYRLSSIGDSLVHLDDNQLVEIGQAEVRELFPRFRKEEATAQAVFRESHAALLLAPGAARLRPLQQSPLQNLLIAGAWTDTGWPANIESAIVSGKRCAEIIAGRPA